MAHVLHLNTVRNPRADVDVLLLLLLLLSRRLGHLAVELFLWIPVLI